MADNHAHPHGQGRVLTINGLTNDDLLAIFDFCVIGYRDLISLMFVGRDIKREIESWQTLVHVCRRWRGLVFGSPRHLNLQLYYDYRTTETLDIWPALPLVIIDSLSETSVDNAAGLEHGDRISQINLYRNSSSQFETIWTTMEAPFPELTILRLTYGGGRSMPPLPDSFLGGSAPRLHYVFLDSIVFPALPKLLLSATQLHHLYLCRIPYSGHCSPETMANCLSMLTSLEDLYLGFEYAHWQSFPERRRPFPLTRSVLPNLTKICFRGAAEYLEEFVARIDAPQLHQLSISYFHDVEFKIPELKQFISRTSTLGAYDEARLILDGYEHVLRLRQSHPRLSDRRMVEVIILPQGMKLPLPNLQVCILGLRVLLTMENLYIERNNPSPFVHRDDFKNTEWSDLFLPFIMVKNLYVSKLVSSRIVHALQEFTGGRTTEMLPALQNIFLEGFEPSEPVEEGIAQLISARQLTNHPVAISFWNR